MSAPVARVPAGVRIGGQFAPRTKVEAPVTLRQGTLRLPGVRRAPLDRETASRARLASAATEELVRRGWVRCAPLDVPDGSCSPLDAVRVRGTVVQPYVDAHGAVLAVLEVEDDAGDPWGSASFIELDDGALWDCRYDAHGRRSAVEVCPSSPVDLVCLADHLEPLDT